MIKIAPLTKLPSKKIMHANHIVARLSSLLDQLTIQSVAVDKGNTQQKSHWLIENNDLFSQQLFKTQSDCFTPYVNETKQRLNELSRLINGTLISDNTERIAKESLAQIEQQISGLMNALQSNQSMHQTAQMAFDIKKKIRDNAAKKNQSSIENQFNTLTKVVMLNSHQLYQKLNEHHEFERRLLDMVESRQQQLHRSKTDPNNKLSSEVLALHQRLGRCRKAISHIERDIELAEKR